MSSSDEGEIVENGAQSSKATSLPHHERSGVDRRDRHSSRDPTPDLDTASRYSGSSRRSRSPRGYKRSRDERDNYRRSRNDQRQGRGHYDDVRRDGYDRSRLSYDDPDRPPRNRDQRHSRDYDRERERDRDDYRDRARDRYSDKRPRHQSRSPRRYRPDDGRPSDRFVRESQSDRRDRDTGGRENSGSSTTLRTTVGKDPNTLRNGTEHAQGSSAANRDDANRGKSGVADPEPEEDYEEPEPIDEEAEIERRRKRREELMAKSSSATPLLLHAVGAGEKIRGMSPASTPADSSQKASREDSPQTPRTPGTAFASPGSPRPQDELSPGRVDVISDKDLMNTHGQAMETDEDGPSAADYDPTVDMREDERRDELRHGQVVLHGEPHVIETTEQETSEKPTNGAKEAADSDDDEFDMFAEDFDEDKYANKPAKTAVPIESNDQKDAATPAEDRGGILEGDDKDGYYKIRVGEVLNGRYQIQTTLGRGMFSGVVRAMDITTKQPVAIKIMRNNDALRKGGYTEIAILQKLNDADPDQRKHIVRFERSFDYKGHLCMVFENLSLNLREVLRKFGNNVGINLAACRTYAYQTFVALAHMRRCSIIHADLKPDNILVNESRAGLKICDLGTAIDRSDAATAHTEITPYLVSRFYRAPEIILGMPYDYAVDMWSVGATLYELYTGKILFTGDSNNQMLKTIMEVRGRLTPKLYKRGQLSSVHFDEQGQFLSVERDKVLNKTTVRTIPMIKPTRDLRTRVLAASSNLSDAESRELNQFIDLLEHCLTLNPDKRIKPADALKHPFFTARSTTGNTKR
ncbi:protein kinase domain-containing protein [Sarocladium implicatum]|nr:protein kinase domain-containing protein [Sarocladium implicatum]